MQAELINLAASRASMETELKRNVSVREYRDFQISCDAWEKVPNIQSERGE